VGRHREIEKERKEQFFKPHHPKALNPKTKSSLVGWLVSEMVKNVRRRRRRVEVGP